MLKPIAFLSLLFAGVHGEFSVVEKRDGPAPGFSLTGPTPLGQILNLRLALTQNDIAGLQEAVYNISTPGNARYGQYLTQDEVNHFVAPSEETLSKVNSWLAANNVAWSPITPAGDWISVNMTVSQANELLDTNQTVVRTLSYSIPSSLNPDISWVHPTVNFPPASARSAPLSMPSRTARATPPRASVLADCRVNSSWTPACLQELYGIPSAPAKAAANVFGVSEFGNNFASKRDLKAFLEIYRPDMDPNTKFDLLSIDGGINNQLPAGAGFFATPDIQYAVGLTTGVHATFISTGTIANDIFTEMLDQAHFLLSMSNPPQTIFNGDYALESQVSPQIAMCTGGWGAGGMPFLDCTPFDPAFPATCPFVTAVGATDFRPNATAETGASFSGGGFSNIFKRPTYQDNAVHGYLESGVVENTGFNASGRAVPDASAISQIDFVIRGAATDLFVSTDYSAAIFASVVAMLNNERIAAGIPGLGLLNPLLYQNPSAFNDVTVDAIGFNATRGWDPVTGFGSPNYPKLLEVSNTL
ncbi:family S53 protease [Mycena vulgaris]|nr:family S53 protease [Mycena vulgaris]